MGKEPGNYTLEIHQKRSASKMPFHPAARPCTNFLVIRRGGRLCPPADAVPHLLQKVSLRASDLCHWCGNPHPVPSAPLPKGGRTGVSKKPRRVCRPQTARPPHTAVLRFSPARGRCSTITAQSSPSPLRHRDSSNISAASSRASVPVKPASRFSSHSSQL